MSEAAAIAPEARASKPYEGLCLAGFEKVAFLPASRRFAVAVNPKAACSSLKYNIWEAEFEAGSSPWPPPNRKNGGAIHRLNNNPIRHLDPGGMDEALSSMPLYSVVRNPYLRILSCYLDKILQDRKEKKFLLLSLGCDANRPVSFEEFVDYLANTNSREMDMHWAPQNFLMQADYVAYAAIGSVEDLDGSVARILAAHYDRPARPAKPFRPHSTGAAAQFAEYFTDRIVELVARRYADDFDAFGYSRDPARIGEPPDLAGARARRGEGAARRAERFRETLRAWNAIRDRNPYLALRVSAVGPDAEPEQRAIAGQANLLVGRLDEAERHLSAAVAAAGGVTRYRILLSECLLGLGRSNEAADLAEDTLALGRYRVAPLVQAAKACRQAGRRDRAARYEADADVAKSLSLA